MELIKDYHALREDIFRSDIKTFWMRERYPLTLASQGLTNLPYNATQLRLVCNKPTLLYWAHSALLRDSFQGFSFACIYTAWFHSHDNLPNLDFGHFFAGPMRILSTGPKSIAEILTAHKSICDRTTSILGKIARGEADLLLESLGRIHNPISCSRLAAQSSLFLITLVPMLIPTLTAILSLVESPTDVVSY